MEKTNIQRHKEMLNIGVNLITSNLDNLSMGEILEYDFFKSPIMNEEIRQLLIEVQHKLTLIKLLYDCEKWQVDHKTIDRKETKYFNY